MMNLLRATTLVGKPLLTLGGESPFEIKDIVFDDHSGGLVGFTLRKHGFLGGPVDEMLRWNDVYGLGPDAVVVTDTDVLSTGDDLETSGQVTGNQVITEDGTDLGEVVEVVVATGSPGEVVGFEIEATPGSRSDDDHHVFIPLPDTLAISGHKIVVPTSAAEFVRGDLSGFGSAVEGFRSQLAGKDT